MNHLVGLNFHQIINHIVVNFYYHTLWLVFFYISYIIVVSLLIGFLYYKINKKEFKNFYDILIYLPFISRFVFLTGYKTFIDLRIYLEIKYNVEDNNECLFDNSILIHSQNLFKYIKLNLKHIFINKMIYHLLNSNNLNIMK